MTTARRDAPAEPAAELSADQLYRPCQLEDLTFESTAELSDLDQTIGQQRALTALEFGVGIRHEGYNLYVMGSPGLGKHHTLQRLLSDRSAEARTPPDWCYVNNFDLPHRPRVLQLPAGTGARLQQDMETLMRSLLTVLPAAFDTDEYRGRVQSLNDEFKGREEALLKAVAEAATEKHIALVHTPLGYTIAPVANGEVMDPAEFQKLDDAHKEQIRQASEEIRQQLRQAMQQVSGLQREHAERMTRLNEDVARRPVEQHFDALHERYADVPVICEFLDSVKAHIVARTDEIRQFAQENKQLFDGQRMTPFNRYFVNVLVDHGQTRGAPVVYEDNPTYQNLIGRIEHLAQFGTLVTDFTLIKGGALHRANGGYLILDARKLLSNPFAWDALKRALRARELRIQSLDQMLSLASTISLEPEPIALDVKVVLCGERLLYYLLSQYDPEFGQLFKVEADFSEDMPRSAESTRLYAGLIATLQRREQLLPMSRAAVARIIEQSARRADDSEKLSLSIGSLLDLMRESDHCARMAKAETIDVAHVRSAADAAIERGSQWRERSQESILRDIRQIRTEGAVTGQINGLAVIALGRQAFGHPSRITATARLGDKGVVDIEREVELGQPIHSKGVMILASYLAHRYGRDDPLSVTASLVFEQSYGMIDGDSASAAELCVLLSCLSRLPLRQDLAITGSLDQHGAVQAIGGVNEKIEGFFDICKARGLSGDQGVIIPASNVVHLMLRDDVVAAVREGRFHVHAVTHVDQAIALLTGVAPGTPHANGQYPKDSVNGRVMRQLREWARQRRRLAARRSGADDDGR